LNIESDANEFPVEPPGAVVESVTRTTVIEEDGST